MPKSCTSSGGVQRCSHDGVAIRKSGRLGLTEANRQEVGVASYVCKASIALGYTNWLIIKSLKLQEALESCCRARETRAGCTVILNSDCGACLVGENQFAVIIDIGLNNAASLIVDVGNKLIHVA